MPEIEVSGKKMLLVVVIAIVGVVGLLSLLASWYSVPEGNVGALFDKRTGWDYTEKSQGWHLKVPFVQRVVDMPFRTQTIGFFGAAEERGSYSQIVPKDNNGINFRTDITVRYRIDPTQAAEFVEQKGEGIEAMENIMSTAARADSTRGVFGKYAQEDVPPNRIEIAQEILDVLQERINLEASGQLKPNFIVVEAVDIRNVDFDDRIEEAIVTKQTQKQEAEKQVYILQQSETQREIELVNADRDKQAAILRAQGKAESILLEAEAKAKGIQKVNDAFQAMPPAYVSTQWATAVKESDNKIIFGLDSVGGVLPVLGVNELIGSGAVRTTTTS